MSAFPTQRRIARTREAANSRTRRTRRRFAVEFLESRTVLSGLNISSGQLIFLSNSPGLTISTTGPGGVYTLTDNQPFVLFSGATAAGWTSTGDTATGPDDSVTSMSLTSNAGGTDSFTIESVDAPVTIATQAVADTFNFTANGIPAADPVTVNDTATTGNNSVTYNAGGTAGTLSTGPFGRETYQAAGKGLISITSSKPGFGDSITNLPSNALTLNLNTLYSTPTALSTTLSASSGQLDANVAGVFPRFFPIGDLASVTVGGTTAGQSLLLNYSNGNMLPTSGLTYDPPAASAGAVNSLTLSGGSFTSETYTATGAGAGTITYNGNTPITFSNLSPVDDTVSSPTFIFNAPAAATTVNVVNGPVVGGVQTDQINDGGTGAFELINFGNKTAATVNTSSAGATVSVDNSTAAAGLSALNVNTANGGNTVNVQATSVATNINTGSGTNTVNVGSAPSSPATSTLSGIHSAVSVTSTGGLTTLNLLDAADTTSANGTINSGSVSGLGFGPGGSVSYSGLTGALVIDGGSHGGSGITYNVQSLSIDTTINNGPNADTVNLTGQGVPTGVTLTLNDNGTDTLNYNTGGLVPTVTAGGPGEVIITLPGLGTTDVFKYANINLTGLPPIPIVPGAATTINSVEGFRDTDAIVGTFGLPTATLLPGLTGPSASAFTSSIDWGDPSPDPAAGTITQDASNPSIYYITATHTFPENGTFTVTNKVDFAGGTFSTTVSGTVVTATLPPSGPTAGTPATATVTQGPLAVSAFPIVGTEGKAIAAGPIATFIDAGGASPTGDYSATISIVNAAGVTVVGPIAATSITQNGNAAQYTVNAPTFTLPEEGTDIVVVTVTDSGGVTPITVVGTSQAVVGDAALTAVTGVSLTPAANTGVLFTNSLVGKFTDANTAAAIGDFKAVIDWGDGSATSLGTIVSTGGGTFSVDGTHAYTKFGTYTTTVNVTDVGGSAVTLTGTAAVTDLAPTGVPTTFTAVEGQNTGSIVLATITDPNPLATAADLSASIVNWGDGSPSTPKQLAVVLIGGTATSTIFQVIGNHTYAEEGLGLPVTLTVTTSGGAVTVFTPATGTANVIDAALSSSNGTEITGIEGSPTVGPAAGTLLGTFTDANQGAAVTDFTAGGGSTVVNWGDSSAPQTLAASNLTKVGSANGVIFTINASHTYAEEGTYAYSVTVSDAGGSLTILSGSAIIADAPLSPAPTQPTVDTTESSIFPVPVFGPPLFNGPVASFTDANPASTIADFTALVDWGDGTPMTAGTVKQPGGIDTPYIVSGSHTYAASGVSTGTGTFGTYPIQVFIVDTGGSRLTVDNTADVNDNSIALTGQLNPATDSGLSTGTVNATNVKQPDFFGSSQPLSNVTLSASLLPSGTPFVIGQVEAGSNGSWNIQADVPLADGHYAITATAIDQFGETTVTVPPSPVVITSNLLIDTTGPVIAGAFFNRLNGQVDYTIVDPVPASGGAPSGVWVNTLLDSSNYLLTKVHANKAFPGKWYVSDVTATPDPTIPFAYDVAVTFNGGATIRGGFYLFTIRDSSNGNSSVQDLAENHLDGAFYGSFPSGNGINGSDFVAELQAYHDKVFAPQTIIGTANAGNGGNGGLRVGPVHSGMHVPVIPRGGSPIFSTPTSPSGSFAARKGKGQDVFRIKHRHALVSGDATHVKHEKLVQSSNHPKGPAHR